MGIRGSSLKSLKNQGSLRKVRFKKNEKKFFSKFRHLELLGNFRKQNCYMVRLETKKLKGGDMSRNKRTDTYQDEMNKMFKEHTLGDKLAKSHGLIFFYHNKLEQEMEKLIKLIAPNVKIKGFKTFRLYYRNKLEILQDMTPNSDKLKLFPFLKKVNQIRNQVAHENPSEIDYKKRNKELIQLFSQVIRKFHNEHSDFYTDFPNLSEEEILSKLARVASTWMGYLLINTKKIKVRFPEDIYVVDKARGHFGKSFSYILHRHQGEEYLENRVFFEERLDKKEPLD